MVSSSHDHCFGEGIEGVMQTRRGHKCCGDHFCARSRGAVVTKVQSPTSKENPSTCCLISCETKGVMYY